jgi:hypothetical protein
VPTTASSRPGWGFASRLIPRVFQVVNHRSAESNCCSMPFSLSYSTHVCGANDVSHWHYCMDMAASRTGPLPWIGTSNPSTNPSIHSLSASFSQALGRSGTLCSRLVLKLTALSRNLPLCYWTSVSALFHRVEPCYLCNRTSSVQQLLALEEPLCSLCRGMKQKQFNGSSLLIQVCDFLFAILKTDEHGCIGGGPG